MVARHIDPLDITIWKYNYIKFAIAISDVIPIIKKMIVDSKEKLIIVLAEDIMQELGSDFKDKSFTSIYHNLKYIMFIHGIAVKSGFHKNGKRLFMMRIMTYRDKLPKSMKKRIKTIKKLMKTPKWQEMIDLRKTQKLCE